MSYYFFFFFVSVCLWLQVVEAEDTAAEVRHLKCFPRRMLAAMADMAAPPQV